jgi:hypothetical protein
MPFNMVPMGAVFYVRSTSAGPYVKTGRTTVMPSGQTPQTNPAQTTFSPVNTICTVEDKFLIGATNAIT